MSERLPPGRCNPSGRFGGAPTSRPQPTPVSSHPQHGTTTLATPTQQNHAYPSNSQHHATTGASLSHSQHSATTLTQTRRCADHSYAMSSSCPPCPYTSACERRRFAWAGVRVDRRCGGRCPRGVRLRSGGGRAAAGVGRCPLRSGRHYEGPSAERSASFSGGHGQTKTHRGSSFRN